MTIPIKRFWKKLGQKIPLLWPGKTARWASLLFAAFMLNGCAQTKNAEPANSKPFVNKKLNTRNNAVSLLYELLGNEKNVSKILIIKSNSDELGQLIRSISEKS